MERKYKLSRGIREVVRDKRDQKEERRIKDHKAKNKLITGK
jgi:hypothetical protein